MAEQKKESLPKDSKEKNSLLDDDFGKEFLGSWKSMSMADDDAMDFSFDTVSKSKKKTFNFDKMDMNFDLDTDFGKMSSFKVDMSDLDFTCSPKKSSQSTDKKGEASSAKAGKKDGFNFNFDFNELDSFNLNSDLLKVDASNDDSNLRKKGITTEGNDSEGAKKPKTNNGDDDESVCAYNDNMTMKPQASERLETLNTDTSVGNPGNLVSRQDVAVSKFSSSENLDMAIKNQTSDISKITSMKEMDQEKDLSEETKSTESKSEQVINKVSSQCVGQSDLEHDTISEQHAEVSLSGTRVSNVASDKKEVNDKAAFVDSDVVDVQLEHSSPPLTTESDGIVREAVNVGSSAEEIFNDPQPEKSDSSHESITKIDASKSNSSNNIIRENKRTALECHLATASSNPIVDKTTLMKDTELQVKKSNIFSIPENKMSLKNNSSTAGTKSVSFDSEQNANIHQRSITQERNSIKSNETKFGSKMVSGSLPGSSKVTKDAPALLGRKDDLKSCNTREGIVLDVTPSAGKLAGNMKSFHEDVNRRKAMFPETSMSAKNVNILSSQVNPCSLTEKTAKITTQISVNSQPEASGKESFQKSKITSIEGNKLSSFKSCKITPAFSSLKTSRNIGANSVLAMSLHQKEAKSLASSEQRKEIQTIAVSKSDHLTGGGDNQKPSAMFLKRKSIEVSEADLTSSLRPLKRLSQSPIGSRNAEPKESSEKVEQVERKSSDFAYHSTSGLESPSEIKITEVEIPDSVLMEDNSNVEKAEAYMKELENICNMLKKRHEEAKELLVRAVVSDNNLLMLNHPIYEEKIRKVQKFASQMMSKEIQT